MSKKGEKVLLICIFVVVCVVYCSSKVIQAFDSKWSIHVACSIIYEGNINLDEYIDASTVQQDYTLEKINGHYYTIFPYGVSIIIIPFVFVIEIIISTTDFVLNLFGSELSFSNLTGEETHLVSITNISRIAHLYIASIIVAITSTIIYLISHLSLSIKKSLLIVFIFSFCTSSWSVVSRGLWQHGPSILMLAISLYLILKAERGEKSVIRYLGLPLAFSFVIRPTNSIAIAVFTIFIIFRYRDYLTHYIAGMMFILGCFIIINIVSYGTVLPSYYLPKRLGNSELFTALVGNLFSPSRGLLVYSPVFLFTIYGLIKMLRGGKYLLLEICLIMVIIIHWFVISSFPHWWGGHSYGPRFFSDISPFLVYFIIPIVSDFDRIKFKKVVLTTFTISILFSFFVHYRGGNKLAVHNWNSIPNNIDQNPGRVWDWNDPQFLRGIVKIPKTTATKSLRKIKSDE